MFGNVGTIGRSVVIKGELSAAENLIIEGQVEGTIDLGRHVLTIGPNRGPRLRCQPGWST